jgi:hypothetical protein
MRPTSADWGAVPSRAARTDSVALVAVVAVIFLLSLSRACFVENVELGPEGDKRKIIATGVITVTVISGAKAPRCGEALMEAQVAPGVNRLPTPVDAPQPALGVRVAHRHVANRLQAMRDAAAVPAVFQPVDEVLLRRCVNDAGERDRVGPADHVECVG